MSGAVAHDPHVQATDGYSKYGSRKRTFEAVCPCGWRSGRNRIGKLWAVEDAQEHAKAVAGRSKGEQ